MKIISRKEAVNQGLKRYFSGKACPRGHISERYVDGRHCVMCSIENSRKRNIIRSAERAAVYDPEAHRRRQAESLRKYWESKKFKGFDASLLSKYF